MCPFHPPCSIPPNLETGQIPTTVAPSFLHLWPLLFYYVSFQVSIFIFHLHTLHIHRMHLSVTWRLYVLICSSAHSESKMSNKTLFKISADNSSLLLPKLLNKHEFYHRIWISESTRDECSELRIQTSKSQNKKGKLKINRCAVPC